MQIAVGAGIAIVAGLSKLLLDLTNVRTKRPQPNSSLSNSEPMTVESFRRLTEPANDWTYHPPPARQ